jgi:Sec-independent protein translocase protein TatA
MDMVGLSTSELAIVVFILLLVIVAGRLPRWGEALGSYLYKRGKAGQSEALAPASQESSAARTPPAEESPRRDVQPPH